MKGSIWAVIVLIAVFTLGGAGVSAMLSEHATTQTVDNESYTLPADHNNTTTLDGEWVIFHNISVYNTSTAAELDRGTDYEFNDRTGELSATNTSSYAGKSVNVSYAYGESDETTTEINTVLSIFQPFLGLIIVGAILGTLMAMLGWWPS